MPVRAAPPGGVARDWSLNEACTKINAFRSETGMTRMGWLP
jgi:hypothetical protein